MRIPTTILPFTWTHRSSHWHGPLTTRVSSPQLLISYKARSRTPRRRKVHLCRYRRRKFFAALLTGGVGDRVKGMLYCAFFGFFRCGDGEGEMMCALQVVIYRLRGS